MAFIYPLEAISGQIDNLHRIFLLNHFCVRSASSIFRTALM